MTINQLGLLLWKNYVVRKRQLGMLGLVFLWPIMVFLILYAVRDNVDPEYHPTCQFPARLMPQDGFLPFLQSFVCSTGNPCESLSEYEEVPSFKNVTLSPLLRDLQPILENDTILEAVRTLPNSIRLLKSMAQILTRPEIKKLFDKGIRLGDLFLDHTAIKSFLQMRIPNVSGTMIDGLFNASIKLYYLIETFSSSNIDGTVCSSESLKKYLILPTEKDIVQVSDVLCHIDSKQIPDILKRLTQHLDFTGLLEMVNRVMAKFRDYDFFEDLKRTSETILSLKIVNKYVPRYLKLQKWVPKIIPLFKNVTFKEIDLSFINRSVDVLNPIFEDERDWSIARDGFLKLNLLLSMIKNVLGNGTVDSSNNLFNLTKHIGDRLNSLPSNLSNHEDVAQLLDVAFVILKDGAKLTGLLLNEHEDEIQIGAQMLDALRDFFPKKILNVGTYCVSLLDNVVRTTYHVAMLHSEMSWKIYNVSRKHEKLVQRIVRNLNPAVYRTIVLSFSRLDFVERFVAQSGKENPEEFVCLENTFNEILNSSEISKDKYDEIRNLICSDEGKKFMSEIYDSFELDNFKQIVENTLSTFVNMAFQQPVKIEKSNLTSAVRSVKRLMYYLETSNLSEQPNWHKFLLTKDWIDVFNSTRAQGRLNILSIHLSIAKMLGTRSLSFLTIKPDLEIMDMLADLIVRDIQTSPTKWINEVQSHMSQLIESFYLTVTDKDKVLKILEYSNFTEAYCTRSNPQLLNYPAGSNEALLKELICRISKSVLTKLEMNVTTIENRDTFNWTAFNEKTIKIYKHIDTLVNQEDPTYNSSKLEKLKSDFAEAWSKNLTVRDTWEISVGLLCKLFDLMESPLFNVQAKPEWNNLYALSWATNVLADSVDTVIDRIQRQNLTLELSKMLYDMPQTEILMEVVLRNLAPITLDIVDMMTLKIPVHFISTIAEYRKRESDWPCIHEESIGDTLELRNGSRQIIREIERISCNPGLFIREWNDQPVLSRVEKIFKDDHSVPVPSFNWTLGYGKFRQLVGKFSVLLENSDSIILTDTPSLYIYTQRFLPEVKTIFLGRLSTVQQDVGNLLDYVDHEIDKNINILKSNLTAYEVWRSTGKVIGTDYIFVVGKFIAHVLYKMTSLALDILRDASDSKIGLLPILGFRDKSAISIVYNEFPNILATVINGISDPTIESRILNFFENGSTRLTCSQLFSWFAYSRVGISSEDYRILKNFTCDMDPENFNAFIDLFMRETIIWRKPVSNYRLYFVSVVGKLYELGKAIDVTLSTGFKIELPFSKKYFDDMLTTLKRLLETKHEGKIIQDLMTYLNSRTYRIVIEGISEILNHITRSLQKVQIKENELHTWELAEIGDVRQLIRLLEAHPVETISLIATINWIDPTTGQLPSFKIFRRTMCNLHFNSVYWSHPNRSHFLNEVCSFDSRQLLKSATSDEFFDLIIDSTTKLQRNEPLSASLTKLLDVVSNFTVANPKVVFKSNIFNATTWKNLDNDTWFLLRKAEESWVHQLVIKYKYVDVTLNDDDRSIEDRANNGVVCTLYETRSLVDASTFIQLVSSSIDLLAGGDVWQKLRNIYESSKMKPLLTMIEDMPNLAVTTIDTFVNSEKLIDFAEEMLAGRINLCDVGKYLITPTFMRKKGLLSSISNFCRRNILNDEIIEPIEFLPVYAKYEKDLFKCNVSSRYPSNNYEGHYFNETYLFEALQRFQSISIRLLSEGIKYPRIPSWWISFEEGTLKDFLTQYKSKDMKMLAHSIVKKTTTLFNNVLNSSTSTKNCFWCNTAVIDILNSQLSHHALYSELVCKMNQLNFSQIQDILIRDFHWNETIHMIKGYRFLRQGKTVKDFVETLENTLYHVVDILIDFKDVSSRKRIFDCFYKFVGGSSFERPGLYVSMLNGIVDFLRQNVYILDTATTHEKLGKFGKLAERNVPIWKPLREVVKTSDLNVVDRSFPNASINVNMFNTSVGRNASALYNILTSNKSGKLLRYDVKAANLSSILEISERIGQSLDHDLIDREITSWRRETFWNLTWLKEILKHIAAVLGESGNLLDVASKIDFQDVSNLLDVPDLADGIVNLLKEKTIDKLFDGLNELLDDVDPFVEDPVIRKDLRTIVEIFESMEIFKNLGLLNVKYAIEDMFVNWDTLRSYLIEKVHIPKDIVLALSQGRVDMLSVFMNERQTIGLKHTICSPKKLEDVLVLDRGQITAEEISSTLCRLDDEEIQNLTVILIKNLNFEYVFKNLMSANVKNILSNANLTEVEGKAVIKNIGVAKELLPFFKEKLSGGFLSSSEASKNDSNETASNEKARFLTSAGEIMCGRPLIANNGGLYKVISNIEDNEKDFDQKELESLPTNFCRETYKSIQKMNGGKIVWSYVKPLIRGYILYAPNSTVIRKVMHLANESFAQMEKFGHLLSGFEKSLISLVSLSEMGDSLKDLRSIMSSDVMKIAVKSLSDSKSLDGDFLKLNLSEVAWQLKRSTKLIETVRMLNNLMECVVVDRIRGLATEEELEKEAGIFTKTNEFLAGVVFLEEKGSARSKRSLDTELPNNVTYKIRMDVDYVPTTNRLKNQFWLPGPESNFIEDLRYLRGFIQLQDSIDRAIVKLKSRKEQNWKTVTQQMPYPCWKYAPFQSVLYESQGIQVCFFFALMMCAGSAVWYIVWEKESQNSMVMSVMGLKPWRNTLAWFITSFVEMSIVIISIWIILIAGKILPRSDPALVLFLLLDYVFAIVTFCYMISMMFNSASLAAVTTVVMFLLTYMPYIIVIAMEASMNLGYKLLICLSMSTSFSYGCLFAVRKEVQGTGLTWKAMWEESSPGDPMSLGLVLVMIALDGCLYALIGYLLARYMNSGRGFHGLRSRSLWWADTRALCNRPSYLAFVNNLYFTNDVTHPSVYHQDFDNDAGCLTIHEKQIGVRFEDVRKVFRTDQGECVAVDDFTLKLCEGEVTALLGRNGAGKTTIIKMLTGMLAPTSGEIFLNGEEGCKPEIGVCPQDNVLIGTLTPREHMVFYARLKKRADNLEIIRSVNAMLDSMELGRQEHEPVFRLSGGTKRRLCVALAFLGSPKLVILDEPGAGVDPAARRRIWRLIDKHRIGRTVLLSTHHLDEADMLSDVVVVMHRGRILCSGSPLTLKMTYGLGYTLNVSYSSSQESRGTINDKSLDALRTTMESVVSNVLLHEVSGSEVVLTLPFQGKHGTANDIAKAAKILEDSQKLLGFTHFSLECDTLERVFLDLCTRADNAFSCGRPISTESISSVRTIGLTVPTDDVDLISTERSFGPSAIKQVRALLKKRIWHFARDWRAPLAALILPTMFVAIAMGFSLIRPPSGDEPALPLGPKLYDAHPTYFYSIDNGSDQFLRHVSLQLHDRFGDDYAGAWQVSPNDTGTCDCQEGQQVCLGGSQAVEGLFQTLPGRPTLDWIVSTHQEYIEKRYGGWSLSHTNGEPLFVVWYNNKGHHSLPAYLSALNEAILRASGVYGHITTYNHPLKLSSDQLNRTTLLQHVADVGIALVLLIAFSLVGAQGARELVRERLSEEKRILYLAGVHPVTYWITAMIWDFLIFGCSICLAIIVFEIFGLSTYVARDNLPATCLLLFLFAWAVIPFTHLAEKAFDDASVSNMVLFCLNTFIGVASLATILVIDILGKGKTAEDIRNILHNILLLLPQYTLGDALVEMAKNDITAELLERFHMDTYKSPLGWELIGIHYLLLLLVGIVLYAVNLTIECRILPDLVRRKVSYEDTEEDDDVIQERMRVERDLANDDVLKIINLRKEFRSVYGTNVAVQNLSFGVRAGQCFGLLGVNGAGKSTTFKMLTTDIRSTAGRIVLEGKEIGRQPLCTGQVGYCPQGDAVDPFLSPHQCLTIHAEVCGLDNVSTAVESMLKKFDLVKYAHQRVNSLSGGNKRKLCAAISVMAPASVVLMDEPTSGMDPASKDLVARVIRAIVKNQGCVLMTSHSVAESENLCTRVGVLARAGLRCIGTPQHLKHKFGEGYVAFLRFSSPTDPSDLKRSISRHLPHAIVSSRQALAARLLLPRRQDLALSTIFIKVGELAKELKATDYTLTQSSLDQVLINFSDELEDELGDSLKFNQESRTSYPNMYSSMDTIHMDTF